MSDTYNLITNLASLVRQLCYNLKQAKPDHPLPGRAMLFLRHNRLDGSPIRIMAHMPFDEDMERVRSRHPDATEEYDRDGVWTVWDISDARCKLLNDQFPKVAIGRTLLGMGGNQPEAWAAAVRSIEVRECVKLRSKAEALRERDDEHVL